MFDYLEFYNNCEFIPMVEAINKMFIFYRAKNLDTFKDAISLPGLAYKMLVKPPRLRRSGLGASALANPSTARSSASAHPGTVAYAWAGPDGSRMASRLGESEPCFCRDAR